jgi:hypothetical protein
MDHSDSIDIAAAPAQAFALLADLPGMGRLSPENTGGAWIGGATGPHVGARFRGTNSRGDDSWSTVARVTAYEAPRDFAFEVTWHRFRISRWEFCVEETSSGCRVTEKWTDRRNALMRKEGDSGDFKREEFTVHSVRTTLERLKGLCEDDST